MLWDKFIPAELRSRDSHGLSPKNVWPRRASLASSRSSGSALAKSSSER